MSVLSLADIRRQDQVFSRMVRERAGHRCQRCGQASGLHCAHVVGRARWRLRWHPDNGIALCWRCHRWAHEHPADARYWFASLLGPERWQALCELRRPSRRREVVDVEQLDLETPRGPGHESSEPALTAGSRRAEVNQLALHAAPDEDAESW